jgi:cellulose synthase/poly-beta-1,6-N-acetylglucosamine synthase-like glycosyltransferase
VVVPALDEERSISVCLDSILAQTHRHLEVIVADGGSRDRTRAIVAEYARHDPRVRLIDNPGRIPPAAMNAAVKEMSSSWLVRIDAHSSIPPDYVERVLAHLRTGRWGGVGGRKDGIGLTEAGRAIAAVMASPFGVGNSTYHHGTEPTTVDHVPFGAYPRSVIDEVGGWNEQLPVNEDYEFDYRVRQAGHELLFDPNLVIAWECRQSIGTLWRQYRRYGHGKAQVVRMHPQATGLRHLAAPALVLNLLAAGTLLLLRRRWGAWLVAPYAIGLTAATATVAPRVPAPSRRFVPAAFVAMHLGWGLGFWEGTLGRRHQRADESHPELPGRA